MSSMCWNWEHMKSSLSLETKGRSAYHRHCLWFYPIILKPLKNVVESDVCWIQTLLTASSPTFSWDLGYLCWYLATVTMQNCFDGTKRKQKRKEIVSSSPQRLTSPGSVRRKSSLKWQPLQARRTHLWGAPMTGLDGRRRASAWPHHPLQSQYPAHQSSPVDVRSSMSRVYHDCHVILEKVSIQNGLVTRTSMCDSDFVPAFGSWILTGPVVTAFAFESKPQSLSSKNSNMNRVWMLWNVLGTLLNIDST